MTRMDDELVRFCMCWRLIDSQGTPHALHELRLIDEILVEQTLGHGTPLFFSRGTIRGACWGVNKFSAIRYLLMDAGDNAAIAIPESGMGRIVLDGFPRNERRPSHPSLSPVRRVQVVQGDSNGEWVDSGTVIDQVTACAAANTPLDEHACMPVPRPAKG